MQQIYYPGFTVGGMVGEAGAIGAVAVLLFLLPFGTPAFWCAAAALALLLMGHGIFWTVTQPVNRVWAKDIKMAEAGRAFFAAGRRGDAPWQRLRDTWEWSHIARAALFFLALAGMAASLTV